MNDNFDTTELEAIIGVDSKHGLDLFAEHVDQLREEIEQFQAEFFERHQTIPPEFYSAGEYYKILRTLVLQALEQLFTSDRIDDSIIDELQATYNKLSTVRDDFALLVEVSEEVTKVVQEAQAAEELSANPATNTKVDTEAIPSPFYEMAEPPPVVEEEKKEILQRNFVSHAKKTDTIFTRGPQTEQSLELITPEILANPKYQKVIEHYFGSPALFEATILREIQKREKPSRLDAFLGVVHHSVFHVFLRDLPLSEILMLQEETFTVMRERVAALQVEYTIYVEWMKDLPVMQHLVRPHAAMTFSDLYVRAELEILWQQFEEQLT
jgi:predicted lipid carrier protein YhbT